MPEDINKEFFEILGLDIAESVEELQPHIVMIKTSWNTLLEVQFTAEEWGMTKDIAQISEQPLEDVIKEIVIEKLFSNQYRSLD